MSGSARILPNYSFEDYTRWEGEWELIEGIPYAMSPMPSPEHQRVSGKIHALFLEELQRHHDCPCEVYQPIDVKINDTTVVHPDILIVCRPIEKHYLDFPPALVVEILTPATALKDKITKYEMYQDFGIRYYLIVDPETHQINYYGLSTDGKYEAIKDPESLKLDGQCAISPNFAGVW